MEKIFVNSKQLSEIIGMPVYSIRKRVREKTFPAYQVDGKNYLFKISEIQKIIEGRRVD